MGHAVLSGRCTALSGVQQAEHMSAYPEGKSQKKGAAIRTGARAGCRLRGNEEAVMFMIPPAGAVRNDECGPLYDKGQRKGVAGKKLFCPFLTAPQCQTGNWRAASSCGRCAEPQQAVYVRSGRFMHAEAVVLQGGHDLTVPYGGVPTSVDSRGYCL